MPFPRRFLAGFAALALAGAALAQVEGPTPLAWRWVGSTRVAPSGQPVVDGNTVYVAVGQRMYALDKDSGNQKWRFPTLDPIPGYFRSTPILTGGTLIGAADNKTVYAIDAATGQSKWVYTAPEGIIGQPVLAGRSVVFGLSTGFLMAIDAASGNAVWDNPYRVDGGTNGRLAAHGDDVILINGVNQLFALNVPSRKPVWSDRFNTVDPTTYPVVIGDYVYLNTGPFLAALNATSGSARWQKNVGSPLGVAPAVSGDGVMVISRDGDAYIYSLDGNLKTKKAISLGSYPVVPPAAAGKFFVTSTTNGAMTLIDSSTGEVVWSYLVRPIGTVYESAPTTTGNPGRGMPGGPGAGGGTAAQNPTRILAVQAAGPAVVAGDSLLLLAADGSLLSFDKHNGVDLTPPDVTMSWPRPGDEVNGQTLDVFFKVEDEASGVNTSTLKISVDGQNLDYTFGRDGVASVHFSPVGKNKSMQNGRKTFTVTVSDWLGNVAKKSFILTIDNTLKPYAPPAPAGGATGPGSGPRGGGGGGGGSIGGGGAGL